jgi:hypothetical protein
MENAYDKAVTTQKMLCITVSSARDPTQGVDPYVSALPLRYNLALHTWILMSSGPVSGEWMP